MVRMRGPWRTGIGTEISVESVGIFAVPNTGIRKQEWELCGC